MAEAKKTKSGKWTILVYSHTDSNGKRVYQRFTADKKRDAEMMAKEFEVGRKKEKRPSDMTVKEALRGYIDLRANVLSPSTIRGYETIYKTAFENIADIELRNIDRKIIQSDLNASAAVFSPKTIKNYYGLLVSALEEFMPGTKFDLKYPESRKIEISIPSSDEINALLDVCDNDDMKLAVMIASGMGLRRGEICAIKVGDIDLENKTLSVTKSIALDKNGREVEKQPKTKSGNRILDIPDFIIPYIEENISNKQKSDYLVNVTIGYITKKFKRMTDALGIYGITFHSLRHYYASVMLANGIPNKYAMRRMGHSTDNMLQRVYQHTMDEKEREVTDTINSFMNDVFK